MNRNALLAGMFFILALAVSGMLFMQGRQTEGGHEAAATGSLRLETLRRVVGRQALEIDFLKRTISRLKALPTSYGENWRMRVANAIQTEEELAKPLIRSCGRAEIGWPTD